MKTSFSNSKYFIILILASIGRQNKIADY